jgi:hypothetical protein
MEIPTQQQTPPSADRDDTINISDVEIYKTQMSQAQFRVVLQNKCVEMSLHVTTGLAGAVAVAVIAAFANDKFDFAKLIPVVLVFSFYGLIQLLILTNYIYQTFMMQGFSHVYNDVTLRSFRKVRSFSRRDELPKDEQAEDKQVRPAFCRFLFKRVKRLQPFIIYMSALLGGLLATASLLLHPQPWDIVISIVVVLFWWCLVLVIYRLHKRVVEPAIGRIVVEKASNQPHHDTDHATR